MDLNIAARSLHQLRDTMFYKNCGLNMKQEGLVKRHIVGYMRGHFYIWVNPIVSREFKEGICVKFKFGQLSKESVQQFEKYFKEVEAMNVWEVLNKAIEKTSDTLEGTAGKENIARIRELATSWFKNELDEWDKKLEEQIMKAITVGHEIKCKKKPGVYNFNKIELSNTILELLNMGKNAIPEYTVPFRIRRKRFRENLLKALQDYRFKIQRSHQIYSQCPREWLKRVIKETKDEIYDDHTEDHLAYYMYVLDNLPQVYQKLRINEKYRRKSSKLTLKEAREELEMEEVMYSEGDKNLGLSLIPCSELKRAQHDMMTELGGEKTDASSMDINKMLEEKVKRFESSLGVEEKKRITKIMPKVEREIILSEARIPYLKLNMKIHKLSGTQMKDSDLSRAKYRPIQDSVGSLLKPYSKICMDLLRDLNKKVKENYDGVRKIETINGVEISRDMDSLETERGQYKTLMSTDFDSAYTNVTKDHLIFSVVNLARLVDWEIKFTKLLIKVISLLLDNNFVEISDGIYKLGTQLAMGCSSSGDALDSVAIWSEVSTFETTDVVKVEATLDENYTVDLKLWRENKKSEALDEDEKDSVKMIRRFRDDGFSIIEDRELWKLAGVVQKVGSMYPADMGNNAKLTHLYSSHLDCCLLLKLGEGKPTRFVRRNIKYPSTIIPPQSNTFVRYKFAAAASELLRYKRICSGEVFTRLNEDLLKNEYVAAGYTMPEIARLFRSVKGRIEARYNVQGDRLGNIEEDVRAVYMGSSIIFDGNIEIKLLENLLRPAREEVIKWRVIVKNGKKLKSLVINRRKDLEKMQTFITKNKT